MDTGEGLVWQLKYALSVPIRENGLERTSNGNSGEASGLRDDLLSTLYFFKTFM